MTQERYIQCFYQGDSEQEIGLLAGLCLPYKVLGNFVEYCFLTYGTLTLLSAASWYLKVSCMSSHETHLCYDLVGLIEMDTEVDSPE